MTREIIVPSLKWNPTTLAFEMEPDTDLQVILGRLALTTQRATDWVTLAHYDKKTGATSYAIAFDPYGALYLNAVTGRSISMSINESSKVYMDVNMFRLSIYLNMNGNYIDNINYLLGNATFLRIGAAGASGHGLTEDKDLLIAGKLEVDGVAYFDTTIITAGNIAMQGGGAGVAVIKGLTTGWSYYELAQGHFHHKFYTRTNVGAALERFRIEGGAVLGNCVFSNCEVEFPKAKKTIIGGDAIQLTNKTGANSVAGQVVIADAANDDAVDLSAAAEQQPIGVFLDSGIADGAEAWIVKSGIADVAMEDNTAATRGNWVKTSDTEAGYADATNAAPPGGTIAALEEHMREVGHCIESVAAGGGGTHILARCMIHFN